MSVEKRLDAPTRVNLSMQQSFSRSPACAALRKGWYHATTICYSSPEPTQNTTFLLQKRKTFGKRILAYN
jgi:hypothetical protein